LSEKNPSYSAVKHGIIGLTKYFATYWADKNVRCNALLPGGVQNKQKKAFIKDLTSRIPLNRMADKNEYHGSIKFLCSDASKYMNGQSLVLDGGRTIW
jgi:NAD(P)-dependent dehydrogenase (short-subunit alcohol dehydrogenase family)